jgi:DNA-binding NarL/FixJ family response regulator
MTKLRILVFNDRVAVEKQPQKPSSGIHGPTNGGAKVAGQLAAKETARPVLTARETEVLKFVAEGLTNEQTALQMEVSIKTVQKHRQSLMNKLNLHHTAGLAGYAVSRNLVFDGDFHRKLAHRFNGRSGPSPIARNPTRPDKEITPREAQILKLLAKGLVNKQIASELNISIKTVGNHRLELMRRLGIHHVAGLTRYAMSNGFIDPDMFVRGAVSQPQACRRCNLQ